MKKELVLEILRERWSPYSFSQNAVEDYKLKAMFEAAGYAPSCNNEQPWVFVFATRENAGVFNDFLEFVPEEDRVWAKEAYALVIAMANKHFRESGKINYRAVYDTGMAVGNMLAQASSMDVFVHQVDDFLFEKVKAYINHDEADPVSVMAAGYLGDGSLLASAFQEEDEHRRPKRFVNEFTFRNMIGNPAF